jgi:hypothetical protein
LKKCTTRIGYLIPSLYPKRIKIGGCVLIIHILIRHAKKIPSAHPESIRLWTPQPSVAFYVFLIVIPDIIRFLSKKNTKSKHPSSLRLALFVTQQCCSDSKVQGQPIIGVYNGVYILNLGATLKHTLTMRSQRLRKMRDSSLTWQRPSTT